MEKVLQGHHSFPIELPGISQTIENIKDALFLPWLPYDEFRQKFADERQDIQKKTFTKWINAHLAKIGCPPVKDLFVDLRDGHKLLALLEVLTNSQYKPEKGRMRVHHINNLNKALNVLQEHGIKLVNISSDDIASGSPKLTLGLIWLIALGFNGQNLVNSQVSNGVEKSLLTWIKQYTEPHGLIINDFSSSWSDGRAFLYIIHANIPNFDLNAAIKKHPNARLKLAFELAKRYFQIDQLLDPEDVNTNKPDKKSILMYVLCLYHAIDSKRSIHDLVQHCESMESISLPDRKTFYLTNEKKMSDNGVDTNTENTTNESHTKRISSDSMVFHPGNITDLDDIPLNSGDEQSSPGPHALVRSSTFTISKSDNNSKITNINIDEPSNEDSKSRPISTATNCSVEIGNYQTALEAVLAILLEDEEILSRDIPEPKNFLDAKIQFHENESLMYKLTDHQRYVGEALEEGSLLLAEAQRSGGLSLEDQNEIRQQMVLLNERWETLRVRALDVQSKIHGQLAEFQIQEIEKLREFLTNAEDRISRMSDIGPTIGDLDRQKTELVKLENDLKEQQSLIDSLNNMVVIVNDESGRFNDLEDKLTALGERWAHVIKWKVLRNEKIHQYKIISKWIDAREKDLKAMEAKEVTELGDITKRLNNVRYCEYDLNELERYLTDLKQMIEAMQEGQNTRKVLEYLENFEDRLDALKQIIEVQRIRIEALGFKFPNNDKRIERPSSWTDFQMIIKFGEEEKNESKSIDENVKEINTENVDMSPQSNKKRKLQKSDNLYLLEGKIIENFNFLDACDDKINALNRQSLKDQSQMIDNIKRDIQEREKNPEDIQNLFKICEEENPNHSLTLESAQVKEIVQRYSELFSRIDELREDIKQMVAKDKFYKSLTGFKLVLADSRDWYKQHANTASKSDLENRLSDMESLANEIDEAKATTNALSSDLKEWKNDFDQFYESWNDMKKAIIRLIQEKGGFDDVNQKIKALEDFVSEIDLVNVVVSDSIKMNANLNKLNALKSKFIDLEDEFNYVIENSSAEKIQDFMDIWFKIPDIVNERIIKQNTAIENLNHFNTEYQMIVKTLKDLETKLNHDIFIYGENEELQNQSTQYDVYAKDLKKIEIDVISARNFSEIILKQVDDTDDHKRNLSDQVIELNDYYKLVLGIYQRNSRKLQQVQRKTEEILKRVHETELWLNDLEMNTPKNQNSDISNSNELFQIKTKFQILKDTCEKETIKFRELNEIGSEMLLQIDELVQNRIGDRSNKNTFLAKKFTKLNARWSEVTSLVYNKTALLEHISSQLGEFKKLIVSESGYLDKLEKKLRNSPKTAADAEEIIEELDDLENNLRSHSDDRLEKIQEIGNELTELEFMADSIQKEVQMITERWNNLQQKAKQRTQILEQEVTEAEKSEKCITIFEKWLNRVDEILTEHLDNDVTVEDLPHDFQRLSEEFRKNEKTLIEVRDLITQHAKKGKVEAANRLQEQLNLLEARFKSCQLKLDKCTAPQAGYESRLNRALGELRNVERTTLVLDVASAGPTVVQEQYQHCLKIYRTLSEVKGEIENTIKTGRKVCEDKFTKDPKQLGQRIDALKHLYNSLGENVTQAKSSLEKLLKLARQLNEEIDNTDKLLRSCETQHQEISTNKNEIFQEIEDSLQKCECTYEEYSKLCEPLYMEDVRQKIDSLKKKYLKITSADVVKSLNEMKSTLQNLDNISVETLKTMETDLQKINVTNDAELELLHLQVIGIVKDAIDQKTTHIASAVVIASPATPPPSSSSQSKDEIETEIVVVSDTVRQRRARTPSSSIEQSANNERFSSESTNGNHSIEAQNPNVLPDLLPKTFRLAETSSLFSQISKNKSTTEQKLTHSSNQRKHSQQSISDFAVVEVREKDLEDRKMSVRSIDIDEMILQPKVSEIVDTINILESVDIFEPEYVETVHIIDVSEDTSDTDSSLTPSESKKSKRNLDNLVEYEPEKEPNDVSMKSEINDEETVDMRSLTQDKVLKVERQRISFEEKRKRIENERDILRDSEDDELVTGKSSRPKPKRSRNNNNNKPNSGKSTTTSTMDCDSFYSSDKENYDEPLVFSEDEDMLEGNYPSSNASNEFANNDSLVMSRIQAPNAKISNAMQNKLSTSSSNNTSQCSSVSVPTSPQYELYKNSTSLEQRVQEFDKTAKYMIRKLEATKEKIESCNDEESVIEHLKLSMAPDAATLISQGDTLVLETHGKSGNLSQIVMKTQTMLREKFRELQQARTLKTVTDLDIYQKTRSTNEKNENYQNNMPGNVNSSGNISGKILSEKRLPSDFSPTTTMTTITITTSSTTTKQLNPEINLDELVTKGLKRIYDLIEKPLDRRSDTDLRRRILEINDRKDDLKLAINAANKAKSQNKSKKAMEALDKAKDDLFAHADSIETSLENLNTEKIQQQLQFGTKTAKSNEKVTSLNEKQKIMAERKTDGENSKEKLQQHDKPKDVYVPGSFSAKHSKLKLIQPTTIGTFDKTVLQISDWLNWEKNMIKSQSILVGDIDAIGSAIEKQKNVLRELEIKKPQLNELVHTAETLKVDVNRQQLQEKVTRLREHWDETSQCVLQRTSQLKNMLGDSQRYESKRLEIETWLSRMENRCDRMGVVATTADILEAQQKEQKSFHAELHQYKHQIELFNALTQKLIAVYQTDDTSRIKRMTESVNQRYNNLNAAVINRGKLLHAALHSLQNFDRSMDQFLAFLSEAESLSENAEAEIDRNPMILKKKLVGN